MLAASVLYMLYEIRKENILSASKMSENENPHQIEGFGILKYPWNDNVHNLDPENNNDKRIDNWNLKKIQLEGKFIMQPTVGNYFIIFFLIFSQKKEKWS